jgi:excisionase family DNA binding protein
VAKPTRRKILTGRTPPTSEARPNGHATIGRSTPIADLPQFLTVDEYAAYLGIGRALAYAEAQTRGVRQGRLLRIPREAVAALAETAAPASPSWRRSSGRTWTCRAAGSRSSGSS